MEQRVEFAAVKGEAPIVPTRSSRAREHMKGVKAIGNRLAHGDPSRVRIRAIVPVRRELKDLAALQATGRQDALLGGHMEEPADRPSGHVDGAGGGQRGERLCSHRPFACGKAGKSSQQFSDRPGPVHALNQAPQDA